LERIISSFILFASTCTRHIFAGIDATGFKITCASLYYTPRAKLRLKHAKLSIGDDIAQIVCSVKVRHCPTKQDNVDFKPILTKMSKIKKLSAVVADKEYDLEDNMYWYRRNWLGTALYLQEINRYLSERLVDDIERR